MKIISDILLNDHLKQSVNKLKLNNSIDFVGYTSTPEIFFNNASLHIFPSICESFGLVLSETKIFGIPNIVVGLDYVSIIKGGTIILYDDNSEFIAKEAIKILKDEKYRKKLGKEARKSMKKFKNELLLKKWVKLILSVYNGDSHYLNLRKEDEKISENESITILKKQVELLKKRMPEYANITSKNIENFTYMKNLK
jgi:glycosyltransferase involved in cell wall biosynthesis